jgi:hypothetical protein
LQALPLTPSASPTFQHSKAIPTTSMRRSDAERCWGRARGFQPEPPPCTRDGRQRTLARATRARGRPARGSWTPTSPKNTPGTSPSTPTCSPRATPRPRHTSRADYHWICKPCFDDFAERFASGVVPPTPNRARPRRRTSHQLRRSLKVGISRDHPRGIPAIVDTLLGFDQSRALRAWAQVIHWTAPRSPTPRARQSFSSDPGGAAR